MHTIHPKENERLYILIYFMIQDSVADLSEESQIEAAIKASLQEAISDDKAGKTNSTTKYHLVFSDDSEEECITVSSDEATCSDMDTDIGSSQPVQLSSKRTKKSCVKTDDSYSPTCSTTTVPLLNNTDNDDVVELKSSDIKFNKQNTSSHKRHNRKRHLSSRSVNSPLGSASKVLRIDDSDEDEESTHHTVNAAEATCNSNSKGKSSMSRIRTKARKGTTESGHSAWNSNETNIEELLASGLVKKEDLAHIVFRLPDGTRIQKAFISIHPIKVSFIQATNCSWRVIPYSG